MRRPSGLVLTFVAGLALVVSPARAEESASVSPWYSSSRAAAQSATAAEPSGLEVAPYRPLRFRINFGLGYFNPSDVNAYLASKIEPGTFQANPAMNILMASEVSVAYYPLPFIGIRPSLAYLFATVTLDRATASPQEYWLSSAAQGLSLDLAYDEGKVSRFFASPGVYHYVAWFEGHAASGLGMAIAVGADFTFGQAHKRGASVTVVVRNAKLGITRRPDATGTVAMNDLDFSSVLLCFGYQAGI